MYFVWGRLATETGIVADINARSGIDRGTLSKLENEEDPNVTMNTLMRYAEAVGKVILVQLEEEVPV